MRKTIVSFLSILFLVLFFAQSSRAQTQGNQPQPLNASVSDFGTSFIFSPPPICSGCVEAELGFLGLQDARFMPVALTLAPFSTHTDFTILANLLDSEVTNGTRSTQFGNRFDFVVRQRLYAKKGITLTIAPRGTVFSRSISGGRVGVTLAAQYSKGNNLAVANVTVTKAIGGSLADPSTDYQGSFDYYRTLSAGGVAVFVGAQHEVATKNPQAISTEQGVVLPFKNGQVELAVEQNDLNGHPVLQFQARVIMNWGKVFSRK